MIGLVDVNWHQFCCCPCAWLIWGEIRFAVSRQNRFCRCSTLINIFDLRLEESTEFKDQKCFLFSILLVIGLLGRGRRIVGSWLCQADKVHLQLAHQNASIWQKNCFKKSDWFGRKCNQKIQMVERISNGQRRHLKPGKSSLRIRICNFWILPFKSIPHLFYRISKEWDSS